MRPSLTGPCNHFFWDRVFGPEPAAFVADLVAERSAVRGDPAQVVQGDELGGPGRVGAGPGDEERPAVMYGTFGPEGAALARGQHPAQVAVGDPVRGDAGRRHDREDAAAEGCRTPMPP